MARKLRIQYEGAIHHVINRGNYRRDLFENEKANQAFEACLFEAAERFEWMIHAFALMINHFHLVIQTAKLNLPEGMQWLQVTHAVRFNRFRWEHGHLFQGRYKNKLVESGPSLARVVNYVHLNPVEAKLVSPERIADYRWSSLYHFVRPDVPPVLSSTDWLAELAVSDVSNIQDYVGYLLKLAADREEQKRQGWEGMNHGWAFGTLGWRQALARDHAHLSLSCRADAKESAEFKQFQWSDILAELLREIGKGPADIARDRRGAPWKVAVAAAIQRKTTAPSSWIAKELNLGAPSSLREYLRRLRRSTS